jgi:hypothetical protein
MSDCEYIGALPALGVARKTENSLIYCCMLDRVYRAVAWQRVDQIRYNMKEPTLKRRRLLLMLVALTATTFVVSTSQFFLQNFCP